jgi:hypothetical protein
MKHVLAAICPDTLRPLNKSEIYRRAARREQIRTEQERIAKTSERGLPIEQQRQVIDLRELGTTCVEMSIACALAAPAALGYVLWLLVA